MKKSEDREDSRRFFKDESPQKPKDKQRLILWCLFEWPFLHMFKRNWKEITRRCFNQVHWNSTEICLSFILSLPLFVLIVTKFPALEWLFPIAIIQRPCSRVCKHKLPECSVMRALRNSHSLSQHLQFNLHSLDAFAFIFWTELC